ncbi:hypothetical protein [Legionella waltersii]|uniref:Uncharacterized protein n=1 Tax=Legionella waltersii TaxID=66969 RepID=A0A0W1ABM1_9GAMM|nr:hypothetical protein [Legionella waltersii]KTD78766.1 hypothetical protein Lwal_1536 [Legionella waltersii]
MNPSRKDLIYEAQTKSISIALIYSPNELNQYIVEIISKDSDLYILENDNIRHFLSVNDAISNAKKYGAQQFFLCVYNTYDECGSMGSAQQFDYIPIHFP